MENEQKSFNNLPTEILMKIFEYQSSATELQKISMVCKGWKSIVEDKMNYLDRVVLKAGLLARYVECIHPQEKSSKLRTPIPLMRNYKRLYLDEEYLNTVHEYIKNMELKYLKIENFTYSKATEFMSTFKDTLEVLEFQNLKSNIGEFGQYPKLKTIKVTAQTTDDIEFLKSFLALNSKSLTTLEMEILCCKEFSLDFIKHLSNLKTLKINAQNPIGNYYHFRGSNSFISEIQYVIGCLPSLENLILSEIPEVDLAKIIKETKKLPLLKNLQLEQCLYRIENKPGFKEDKVLRQDIPFLTKFELIEFNSLSFLTTTLKPHLTELKLTSNRFDLNFSVLIKNCPLVETFGITSEDLIGEQFLNQISKGWTNLKTLVLNSKDISFSTKDPVVVFPKLTTLFMHRFSDVDKFFKVVRAPKLLRLNFANSIFKSGKGKFHKGRHNKAMLESLKSVVSNQFFIPGTYPNANHIKMKMGLDDVVPFVKNLKSKSLNCELVLSDDKIYTNTNEPNISAMKYIQKYQDELNLKIYDYFQTFISRNEMLFVGILLNDGFRLYFKYTCKINI